MKLELGSGQRPTRGYSHNDLHPFDHIEHVGHPWMIDLPDGSLDEALALAFIEHLTYEQALDTFRNVARMLTKTGQFLFDVPDYPRWAEYYLSQLTTESTHIPYTNIPDLDHCRRTLFGWGRWPGDEHKYGWDADHLSDTLGQCGLVVTSWAVEPFIARTYRQRFWKPVDAHLYVTAVRG